MSKLPLSVKGCNFTGYVKYFLGVKGEIEVSLEGKPNAW